MIAVVAMSILATLGTMPDGRVVRLEKHQFEQYIKRWHPDAKNNEKPRRKEARKRIDLYKDRGRKHIEEAIDKLYRNAKVKEWRKAFIEFAEFQNVTNRVIRETSTVYSEPANRLIKGDAKKYKEFQDLVSYDHKLRSVNRLGNLTNDVLVWPTVVESRPVLRVVTQDRLAAIPHPNDPLKPALYIVDQFPDGMSVKPTDPHYLGMSELEWLVLDKEWNVLSVTEHGLDRMPALLWHREEPDEMLLDWHSGQDLTSAHLAVALLNTMMLKHQKGGTKQAYATGDTSGVARGQAFDEESLLELGDGVTLNTIDMGADPSTYIEAVRAVIKQIAANRGIPESVFDLSYQATSGFEIELKRTGLREIRRDQIMVFKPFERKLADLWSLVLEKSDSEWKFSTDGWSVDFGEIDTPQDPAARLEYWRKSEELDLINRVQMYMKLNPEATPEEAKAAIEANRKERVKVMRTFQAEGQSPFSPRPEGGQTRPGGRVTPEDARLRQLAKEALRGA